MVSTVVQDSPHKIFIGGLPNYLNEDQVSLSHEMSHAFCVPQRLSFWLSLQLASLDRNSHRLWLLKKTELPIFFTAQKSGDGQWQPVLVAAVVFQFSSNRFGQHGVSGGIFLILIKVWNETAQKAGLFFLFNVRRITKSLWTIAQQKLKVMTLNIVKALNFVRFKKNHTLSEM